MKSRLEFPVTLSDKAEITRNARAPELEKLRCPKCHSGNMHLVDTLYRCNNCSQEYEILFSRIPCFLLPDLMKQIEFDISPENPAPEYKDEIEQKIFQRLAHDKLSEKHENYKFDIERPFQHRMFEFLSFHRLLAAIGNEDLKGSEVLVVCAGRGMDAELLSRKGAIITTIEISPNMALSIVDRFAFRKISNIGVSSIIADAENLPFNDQSFDYVVCYEGLHHLPSPLDGVREMCRVARTAVFFAEPSTSLLMPLARLLGRGKSREWCGNEVFRFTRSELVSHINLSKWKYTIKKMYKFEKHRPGPLTGFFSKPIIFQNMTFLETVARKSGFC